MKDLDKLRKIIEAKLVNGLLSENLKPEDFENIIEEYNRNMCTNLRIRNSCKSRKMISNKVKRLSGKKCNIIDEPTKCALGVFSENENNVLEPSLRFGTDMESTGIKHISSDVFLPLENLGLNEDEIVAVKSLLSLGNVMKTIGDKQASDVKVNISPQKTILSVDDTSESYLPCQNLRLINQSLDDSINICENMEVNGIEPMNVNTKAETIMSYLQDEMVILCKKELQTEAQPQVENDRSVVEETRQLRVNVEDFCIRTLIGKGYFGHVHLVTERLTGDIYAMKKIRKSVVSASQVKEERDIMSKRCSDWITNLQYAFQDNEHLYLIMEYLPGGDLLCLMSKNGPFDEPWTRFYLAELTLAIHALHEMGYVHRDIKPENILIDSFGHIKLADFGNAAALDRDGHVFSLSPVGTPDYIAPELLQTISTHKLTKNIHDVSCDYWSMGIIGYELVCETTPFHEDNVHETYSKILSHCEASRLKELISFPNDLKLSNNYKNLIESLVTNPSNRLNYESIRKHPFFECTKWETLRSQVPPIIPKLQSSEDTSNFEYVQRKKTKAAGPNAKKSFSTTMVSNEFSGKDLPFIGYNFVHMEKNNMEAGAIEDERFVKANNKLKEMQQKYKERLADITHLRQDLLRAELVAKQSNTQSKILEDAKEEITKLKNIIKDKNLELATNHTQIKSLQSSLKIEQEMWEKKEATITDLLRMNRQKYEDAKNVTEARYEKRISEKKAEINVINKNLDERQLELTAKVEECSYLQEKMQNYKEMLKQQKEQAQRDLKEFENNKEKIIEIYEQKLIELRSKLRNEKDHKSRLTMELRDVRNELDDSIISTKSTEEAKLATAKATDDILKRLNDEIEANNELHKQNTEHKEKLLEAEKQIETLQHELNRLERELKVSECSKKLAESDLATQTSPYETARGSLTDIRVIEEQLRADLETAKDNETSQKARADNLQNVVAKLEQMIEHFNEQSLSPNKPLPAPRSGRGQHQSVGDMLEKQNEKLEDKLEAVREQMIIERQSARSANLALWKAEKHLEEVLAEKKINQRRVELMEDRIKKIQAEKSEAMRMCKLTDEAKKQREDRIEEMKQEIISLKSDVLREHRMWEKAEQERMKCKTEIIEHISSCKKIEEQLTETRQNLYKSQQKCDKLDFENKTLIEEANDEKDRYSNLSDRYSALQIQMKNLQDNYERLKYACTITDTQLTEVESMLEKEQKCNKSLQEKIDQLYASARKKDDLETQLKRQLNEEKLEKETAETKVGSLTVELQECRSELEELQNKLSKQQQYVKEQTSSLFVTQEKVEVLQNENQNIQTIIDHNQRELVLLKEENAHILSDLFNAKQESQQLRQNLKDVYGQNGDLENELQDLKKILEEKENYYLQREIKSEATLAQHKKLIDYLQLKVEDLTQKKKKTFADKIFGSNNNSSSSSKKENLGSCNIETSILYRTLQEELKREKLKSKCLQEQLDKFQEKQLSFGMRSPLKSKENQRDVQSKSLTASPQKPNKSPKSTQERKICHTTSSSTKNSSEGVDECGTAKHLQSHHRFELALHETNKTGIICLACKNPLISGSAYWKCRECKNSAHRKCRKDVTSACGDLGAILASFSSQSATESEVGLEATLSLEADIDTESLGKFSYEAKLDDISDDAGCSNSIANAKKQYTGTLVFSVPQNDSNNSVEVACAFEMEENKILLLGCNTGLYAFHIDQQTLVHIAGVDSISCIAISQPLAKVVMVGSGGETLYQCDLRHLQSRCQASASLKPALEASVIDLPFANRTYPEKWKLVQISQETEQPLDTVAIGATSTRIVILKYDVKQQKFKPVRALDTATPVSSILYTRHTAIVSSDKFFEIDLETYGAEEFVDIADQTLSHTQNCQPVEALRISKQEFLLCFMECGVFVDEYGCRSRPYDINWEYTPCGFMYRAPFLYVAHFQYMQLIRLHRSYTNEVIADLGVSPQKDLDADIDTNNGPKLKRSYLNFYMPTLLTASNKFNAFMLTIQKHSGHQEIYHLDALQIFKQHHNESIDTISSIATSVTLD